MNNKYFPCIINGYQYPINNCYTIKYHLNTYFPFFIGNSMSMPMSNMSICIASCGDLDGVNEANDVVYCAIGAVIDGIVDLMISLYIFSI